MLAETIKSTKKKNKKSQQADIAAARTPEPD